MKTQLASISVACLVVFSRIDARFTAASQQSRNEIDATGNVIETHEQAGDFREAVTRVYDDAGNVIETHEKRATARFRASLVKDDPCQTATACRDQAA